MCNQFNSAEKKVLTIANLKSPKHHDYGFSKQINAFNWKFSDIFGTVQFFFGNFQKCYTVYPKIM